MMLNRLFFSGILALFSLSVLTGCSSAFVVAPQRAAVISPHQRQSTPLAFPLQTAAKQQNTYLTQLSMATEENQNEKSSNLPFWLDIGTKGGALFLSLVAFVVPIIFYEIITSVFNVDGLEAGKWIGGGFTVFATLAWSSTYIFRVATKDMTYAKQLKDYENAVIAKRLEELDEDELQALVEEVERDDF